MNKIPTETILASAKNILVNENSLHEKYLSTVEIIHKSILNGDCFQNSELVINRDFTSISETILELKSSNFQETEREYLDELYSCIKLYHEFTKFIYRELRGFSSEQNTINLHSISRTTDIKPLRYATERILYNKRFASDSNEQSPENPNADANENFKNIREINMHLIRLNLLICEADFTLSCNKSFISNLTEIYSLTEFWVAQIKASNSEFENLMGVLLEKCKLILSKALRKRSDLDKSIDYYSYQEQKFVRFNSNDLFTENTKTLPPSIKEVIDMSLGNAIKNTFKEANENRSKLEFQNKVQKVHAKFESLQNKITKNADGRHVVDFGVVHFVCKFQRLFFQYKYIRQKNPDLSEAIHNLDRVYKDCSIIFGETKSGLFNEVSKKSLLFFIANTKLRIYEDIISYDCLEAKERNSRNLSEIYNKYKVAETKFEDCDRNYNAENVVKDYLPYKSFLKISLEVSFLYLRIVEHLLKKPETLEDNNNLDLCSKYLEVLSETSEMCAKLLPIYNRNLNWAENRNHMALYLPYHQCKSGLISAENDLPYSLFLCSSYLTPINYYNQKQEKNHIGFQTQELLTRFLIATKNYGFVSLNYAKNKLKQQSLNLQESIEKKVKENIDEATGHVKQQIDNQFAENNLKSFQYLGVFSAVIAIVITVWQNNQLINSIHNFSFGITFIGGIIITLLLCLSVITLRFSTGTKNENIENWIKLGLLLIFAIGISFYALNLLDETDKGTTQMCIVQPNDSTSLLITPDKDTFIKVSESAPKARQILNKKPPTVLE